MSGWATVIPQIDFITGTPVRFRPGQEPAGFPYRDDMNLFVRPWGDEGDFVMVVDDSGTSMPVRESTLAVDLEHPLGFHYALSHLYTNAVEPEWETGVEWKALIIRSLCCSVNHQDRMRLAEALQKLAPPGSAEEEKQ